MKKRTVLTKQAMPAKQPSAVENKNALENESVFKAMFYKAVCDLQSAYDLQSNLWLLRRLFADVCQNTAIYIQDVSVYSIRCI